MQLNVRRFRIALELADSLFAKHGGGMEQVDDFAVRLVREPLHPRYEGRDANAATDPDLVWQKISNVDKGRQLAIVSAPSCLQLLRLLRAYRVLHTFIFSGMVNLLTSKSNWRSRVDLARRLFRQAILLVVACGHHLSLLFGHATKRVV